MNMTGMHKAKFPGRRSNAIPLPDFVLITHERISKHLQQFALIECDLAQRSAVASGVSNPTGGRAGTHANDAGLACWFHITRADPTEASRRRTNGQPITVVTIDLQRRTAGQLPRRRTVHFSLAVVRRFSGDLPGVGKLLTVDRLHDQQAETCCQRGDPGAQRDKEHALLHGLFAKRLAEKCEERRDLYGKPAQHVKITLRFRLRRFAREYNEPLRPRYLPISIQNPSMRIAETSCILLSLLSLFSMAHAGDQPNILWINAEDMSPHLGCYGDGLAKTPNIDRLAAQGVLYRNAFATAPICSPARSCLATGLYATSMGTQHLRCEVETPDRVIPLANRLRELGYFCTNTGKSDYNFDADGIWNAWSSQPAPWRAREKGQPFFAFITVGETHEGRINFEDRYEEATRDLPDELRHNPADVKLPPFYPDSPEVRRIFAGMYDLASVFDLKVAEILSWLKEDGDAENTIVFVFADHGNGLPRYKRWLNDSGLRVPLVIYVPPKFRHLGSHKPGSETDRLVSFVDFPTTAISLAGGDIPDILQGEPFLGTKIAEPRRFVYGARSRADDMFEVSRSVFDGRYLYVRHFLPHLPYIQPGVILDNRKRAFRELRRLHEADMLDGHAARIWADRKPVEEFYDLKHDPYELDNLATSPDHMELKQQLAKQLRRWILEHRDSGFLPEAEYQIRAREADLTPFEIVQDPQRFNLKATLDAAWRVGDDDVPLATLIEGMQHKEAGVRYWSAVAMAAREVPAGEAVEPLTNLLEDPSPSVRIAAAEALIAIGKPKPALDTLGELVQDKRPWVALQAARALALAGEQAQPLVPVMQRVIERLRSEPGSRRVYKDFNYASFTGWALEMALANCGSPVRHP